MSNSGNVPVSQESEEGQPGEGRVSTGAGTSPLVHHVDGDRDSTRVTRQGPESARSASDRNPTQVLDGPPMGAQGSVGMRGNAGVRGRGKVGRGGGVVAVVAVVVAGGRGGGASPPRRVHWQWEHDSSLLVHVVECVCVCSRAGVAFRCVHVWCSRRSGSVGAARVPLQSTPLSSPPPPTPTAL